MSALFNPGSSEPPPPRAVTRYGARHFAVRWLAPLLLAFWLPGNALAIPHDTDGDAVKDFVDNCTLVENPGQGDGDHDGRGTACDADLTQDLFVGGPDFTAYILCFGAAPTGSCAAADFNEDGVVDRFDFPLLVAAFDRPPGPSAGGQVHGYVSIRGESSSESRNPSFRLPRIAVFLVDVMTGRASRRAVTDPHGYFEIPRETIGEYQVCVEGTHFFSNCDSVNAMLTYKVHTRADDYTIEPIDGGLVGEVLQRDPLTLQSTSCFRESSYFQTLDQSIVTLLDQSGNTIRSVAANSQGEYLLPGLPAPGNYRLRATCGPRTSERVIAVNAGGSTQSEDFSFTNSQPRIRSLEASFGGTVVQEASPGDLLQLTVVAVDPDGEPLHYQWRSETAGFVSQDSATVNWPLPVSAAENTVYLEVSDESGGFATQRLTLSTAGSGVLFQGVVADRDTGLPISGVAVSVDGNSENSSVDGGFALQVDRADRYVLNAQKYGYTFVSQIFHASTVGLKLFMRAQPVVPVDPSLETLLNTNSERNPLQATLRIPANCLAQRDGTPPPGDLKASLYTYDPTEAEGIPGDFSAFDANLKDVRLESFGAFGIDVWDPSGATPVPYTLAPGCAADFETEIPTPMIATAPASIPLLEYDPVQGYWEEVAAPAVNMGGSFVGSVPGFSSWNTDVTFSDSACIKVVVDESTISYPFKIRVTIPTGSPPGTGVDKIKEFPVTGSPNGLFRLPPNENIKIEMIDDQGLGVVYKTIVADSGAIVPEPFPPSPYSDCQGIDNATNTSPVILGLDVPTHNRQWLSQKFGIYSGNTLISEADQTAEGEAYYDVIDPPDPNTGESAKDTLTKWLAENGFPADEVKAVYYNSLDLKLGRQMHCRQTVGGADAGDVACAVTNFGQPGGPPADALSPAIQHLNGVNIPPGATVTMEYDASIASSAVPNQVTFYVFGPDGNRVPRVALDIEGEKPVPHICLVCHGGQYDQLTHSVTGAAFREFDVFGFEYDDNNVFGLVGQDFSLSGQQEDFRKLNAMVKSTDPKLDAGFSPIIELIDGFYQTGVENPGSLATDTYVPTAWSAAPDPPPPATPTGTIDKSALYNEITKVHCRACHIAQDGDLTFYEYNKFKGYFVEFPICVTRTMPHAEAPFRNFWLSTNPAASDYLGDATTGVGFSGACPAL